MRKNKILSRCMILIIIISFLLNHVNTSATNLLKSISNGNNKCTKIEIKYYKPILVKKKSSTNKISKKKIKAKKKKYKQYKKNLYILSHVIDGEARGSSKKDKLYVGSVVLNRVKDKRFPNSIKGVVFAHNQYACTWDGNYNKNPIRESIIVAKYLLKHGSQLPKKVVWQSQAIQGKGIYCKVGRHYYCW